jgi:hypothetical protein
MCKSEVGKLFLEELFHSAKWKITGLFFINNIKFGALGRHHHT